MEFREKIDKVLKIRNIKLWKLAEESGLGNTLEKAYERNGEMRDTSTEKFLQNLGISKEWWENPQDKLLNYTEKRESENLIPFYDTIAVGGYGLQADQASVVQEPVEMINPGTFLKGATGALRVYGHSMYPKYPAGCIVAFKASSEVIPSVIIWGEDYVIELEERRIIKKVDKGDNLETIKAVSLNGTNGEKHKYQYDSIDIPLKKIKRMYMVVGKIELEASI